MEVKGVQMFINWKATVIANEQDIALGSLTAEDRTNKSDYQPIGLLRQGWGLGIREEETFLIVVWFICYNKTSLSVLSNKKKTMRK